MAPGVRKAGRYLRGRNRDIVSDTRSIRFPWPVEVSLMICVVIWGTNFVVLKAALPTMHAQALNFFRMVASLLAVASVHMWASRQLGQGVFELLKLHPVKVIATGILGYTVYQIAFILGLDGTTAGSAALIMASSPVWTAILAVLMGLERLALKAWGGLFVSLAGVAFIILSGQEVSLGVDALKGNLIMLVAAVCWASYTTFNRPLLKRVPAIALTFYGVLFSMVPLAMVAAPYFPESPGPRYAPSFGLPSRFQVPSQRA